MLAAKTLPVRVLEIAVIAAIVALVWSNYSLRAKLFEARAAGAAGAFEAGERFELGRRVDLTARTLVSVLDPSCGSCANVLADIGAAKPSMPIVLVTREGDALKPIAARHGLGDHVLAVSRSAPPRVQQRFMANPQILIVERSTVVRTCDRVAECVGNR